MTTGLKFSQCLEYRYRYPRFSASSTGNASIAIDPSPLKGYIYNMEEAVTEPYTASEASSWGVGFQQPASEASSWGFGFGNQLVAGDLGFSNRLVRLAVGLGFGNRLVRLVGFRQPAVRLVAGGG